MMFISVITATSTGALTNGAVRIGCGSFVGSGAIIREGIDLPKMTVIGAENGDEMASQDMNMIRRTLIIAKRE